MVAIKSDYVHVPTKPSIYTLTEALNLFKFAGFFTGTNCCDVYVTAKPKGIRSVLYNRCLYNDKGEKLNDERMQILFGNRYWLEGLDGFIVKNDNDNDSSFHVFDLFTFPKLLFSDRQERLKQYVKLAQQNDLPVLLMNQKRIENGVDFAITFEAIKNQGYEKVLVHRSVDQYGQLIVVQ
jgi:hypothetical protein